MFDADDNRTPYKEGEFLLSEMEVNTEHGIYWTEWDRGYGFFSVEPTIDIVDEAIWRMME